MGRGTVVTRRTKDGKKRYYAAVWVPTPDGGSRQQWRTFDRKKDADAFLDDRSKEVRDGDYREPIPIRFDKFCDEWLEKYPRIAEAGELKPSTINGYRSIIKAHLKPFFKNHLVHQIQATTIQRDFLPLLPKEMKGKTRRNVLMLLQRILRSAVAWGYINRNPFRSRNGEGGVSMPKPTREQKGRALNLAEIKTLLEHCYDDAYVIVLTAALTGMRRGEIFGLQWPDVEFNKDQIHVQRAVFYQRGEHWGKLSGFVFTKPKSKGSDRRIDMSPQLKKALKEHWLAQDKEHNPLNLVFPNQAGKPIEPDNFCSRRFATAVKHAKLGKLRFHDLRHTFGSLKIQQGENLKYVQQQMGHASIQITCDVYAHLLKGANQEAAARTDELIFGETESAG
jgi:integrase